MPAAFRHFANERLRSPFISGKLDLIPPPPLNRFHVEPEFTEATPSGADRKSIRRVVLRPGEWDKPGAERHLA
jgi:hypothetical protein